MKSQYRQKKKSLWFQDLVLGPGAADFYTFPLQDLIHSRVNFPVCIDDSLILASGPDLSPILAGRDISIWELLKPSKQKCPKPKEYDIFSF